MVSWYDSSCNFLKFENYVSIPGIAITSNSYIDDQTKQSYGIQGNFDQKNYESFNLFDNDPNTTWKIDTFNLTDGFYSNDNYLDDYNYKCCFFSINTNFNMKLYKIKITVPENSRLTNSPENFKLIINTNNGYQSLCTQTGVNWSNSNVIEFTINNYDYALNLVYFAVNKINSTGQTSLIIEKIEFTGDKYYAIQNVAMDKFGNNLALIVNPPKIFTAKYSTNNNNYIWTLQTYTDQTNNWSIENQNFWNNISINNTGDIICAIRDTYIFIGCLDLSLNNFYRWYRVYDYNNLWKGFMHSSLAKTSTKTNAYAVFATDSDITQLKFNIDSSGNFNIDIYNTISQNNIVNNYVFVSSIDNIHFNIISTSFQDGLLKFTYNYQPDSNNTPTWSSLSKINDQSWSKGILIKTQTNGYFIGFCGAKIFTHIGDFSNIYDNSIVEETNATISYPYFITYNLDASKIIISGNNYDPNYSKLLYGTLNNNQYTWTNDNSLNISGNIKALLSDSTGNKNIITFEQLLDKIYMSMLEPSCYLKGTKILTNNGYIKIEDLKIGNLILTHEGYKPIKYIGYNKFNYYHNPNVIYKLPKDSIKINEPFEDLYILHWHSLIYDNCNEIDLYKKDSYDKNIYEMINKISNYYKLLCRDHHKCIIVNYDELKKSNLIDENDIIMYYNIVIDKEEIDINENSVIYANGILSESITEKSIDTYKSLYKFIPL